MSRKSRVMKILEDVVSRKAVSLSSTNTKTKRVISRRSILTLACSALLLSACGFQLRGQQDYAFKRLAVNGATPEVLARIERVVEGGSNTVIVKGTEKPDAILTIGGSQGQKTLSLNAQGIVQEYEL